MAVEVAALFLAVVIAMAVVAFAVVVAAAVAVVVAVAVSVQQDGVACADLAVDAEVRDHQALVSEEYDSQVDYVYAYLVH